MKQPFGAVLIGCALAACSTTTTFVVDNAPAGAVLDVGDAPVVPITAQPLPVEIAAGSWPVPWKVRSADGTVVDEGTIERDGVQWPVVATGLGLGACCMPTGAALGFCLANPALLVAPISCLAAGNAGVVVTTLASPSWASGPLTAAGCAVGATPVLLGLSAQTPPTQVTITLPRTAAAAAATNDDDDDDDDMAPASTTPPTDAPAGVAF